MHPNPAFHTATDRANLDFARGRGFGVLAVSAEDGPLMAHVPFLLSADGAHAGLHLVRSNPIARMLDSPVPAVIAVSGPEGYVSPDWYGVEDQVPTWNYVAVHLRGTLCLRPQAEMRDLLDRQSAHFEAGITGKPPWRAAKMTPEVLDRMMRQIVPCRLEVSEVRGTWKLSQNKPNAVRRSAAAALDANGQHALAALMTGAGDA